MLLIDALWEEPAMPKKKFIYVLPWSPEVLYDKDWIQMGKTEEKLPKGSLNKLKMSDISLILKTAVLALLFVSVWNMVFIFLLIIKSSYHKKNTLH